MFSRLVVVAAIVAASAGIVKRGTFAGHAWSIEVPADYINQPSLTPDRQTKIIAFTPDPRADGTRPMIQVTFRDLSELPKSPGRLQAFADALIGGIQRRREKWTVEKTTVEAGGRTMLRYAWGGVIIPAPDGAAQRMRARGVLLVGIEGDVGFALSTQDAEAYAGEILPVTERAMGTFNID